MGVFDHWHPVLPGRNLGREPVSVRLHGTDLVLFRTAGQIGALEDNCPHRRMKLSRGSVVNGRLQCSYHGWSFDCRGHGRSPGTPRLHAAANAFVALEHLGVIWAKSDRSTPDFPRFPTLAEDGYFHLGNLHHEVQAPLEITLDNFCEIEHTPTTHAMFGYDLDRMPEVQVRFEASERRVRVVNHGPTRRMSWIYRKLLGIRSGDHFFDDWTTHFSPVYSVYDHWWADPVTGREGSVRWKLLMFFTPVDERKTSITTFAFTKSRYPGPAGGMRLVRRLLLSMISHEIDLDIRTLEGLSDQSADLDGMKLSRFDKALALNRERLNRVYRGLEPHHRRSLAVAKPCAERRTCPAALGE